MKKITALFLAILCLVSASLCALPVAAAPSFSVTLSAPTEVKWGEQICVTVSLSSIPTVGICGFDIELDCDTELLTFDRAAVSGLPSESWTMAGRTSKNGYILSVFDDFSDTPTHIYAGTAVQVKLYFKANKAQSGTATVSAQTFGSVTGSYYDGKEVVPMSGTGNKVDIFVYSYPTEVKGDGWQVLGGYLYCDPDMTAERVDHDDGYIYGKDGSDPIFTGDSFVVPGYSPIPVGVRFDVNGDGIVTTADYLSMKKYTQNGAFPDNGSFAASDVNFDGVITAADAVLFRVKLSGGNA